MAATRFPNSYARPPYYSRTLLSYCSQWYGNARGNLPFVLGAPILRRKRCEAIIPGSFVWTPPIPGPG